MQVTTFPCPHCAAILRIRDRMFVGQIVGCPDCGEQLFIVADGSKGFRAEKAPPPEPASQPARSKKKRRRKNRSGSAAEEKTPAAPKREREWVKNVSAKLLSPMGIAWGTAAVSSIVLITFMLSGRDNGAATKTAGHESKSVNPDVDAPPVLQDVNPWRMPAEDVGGRMQQLGVVLKQFEQKHERLPWGVEPAEGLALEQRFSWNARLAAMSKEYGSTQPHWNRPWSDPVNERFRTQSIVLFRNPRLPPTPGRDRLPVSHFVGVAGVGADGPTLAADHPRAGIFAHNRATRLTDIKDGLEHTMMIAGAQSHLSGWAVGGSGTIRPFTKTPYVNGPDGFGTGHGDRMLVLMADGSVREVSKDTNPVIVRRMAAMADGLTLDPNQPGDPALLKPKTRIDPPPKVVKKQKPAKKVPAKKKPPTKVAGKKPVQAKKPSVVEKPKTVDVAAALDQPILRFEQSSPQPLRILLDELEELIGLPVRYDKQALAGKLDERVALKLENTTVKQILEGIAAKAGLEYKVEADGLRLAKRDNTAPFGSEKAVPDNGYDDPRKLDSGPAKGGPFGNENKFPEKKQESPSPCPPAAPDRLSAIPRNHRSDHCFESSTSVDDSLMVEPEATAMDRLPRLRALSREEVRSVDRIAIDRFHIPGIVLMENAGRGAAELLMSLGIDGPVVICCGKGNNGGDGFVIARHLEIRGYDVRILLFCDRDELTGDAETNCRIAEAAGTPMRILTGDDIDRQLPNALANCDWIVDALLGTGVQGSVREPFPRVIECINQSAAQVFAVDLPSGLDCDTGVPLGCCVKARHTATFVARKLGFDNAAAGEWTGDVHVIGIGVPPVVLHESCDDPSQSG
eukprot:g12609.t1